ncbi:paraneoplastic antigen Ma3-like [Lingula anatina]|uniref:Paraneoplastic antigen Ma3-like n=1 Tax=Lingula anatina TaxID=7574 RepID=A0A1S3H5G9_LINAN|nr:paraneoplastic antigen Ma3-like [Lingula anatina]|eukprot:XP_013380379.1 paraneoplastic antigen Ma3-like [Lingula anatina]
MQVVERGGIEVREVPEHLLRQFIRGSFDEELINKLDLEKLTDPPSFAELLLLVRREEARRTEKRLRLEKKKEARVHSMTVSKESEAANVKMMEELQARVAKLEAKGQVCAPSTASRPEVKTKVERKERRGKKSIFCFKCGEDGHVANGCEKTANAELVQKKLLQKTLNSEGTPR